MGTTTAVRAADVGYVGAVGALWGVLRGGVPRARAGVRGRSCERGGRV